MARVVKEKEGTSYTEKRSNGWTVEPLKVSIPDFHINIHFYKEGLDIWLKSSIHVFIEGKILYHGVEGGIIRVKDGKTCKLLARG